MEVFLFSCSVGVAVIAIGWGVLLLRASRREHLLARQRALQDYDVEPPREPTTGGGWVRALHRLGERAGAGRRSRGMHQELARAGYHSSAAADVYIGAKVLCFVVGVFAFSLLLIPLTDGFASAFFGIMLGATSLFFLPNLFVAVRRDRRRAEVASHLPDSIDLLDICVSSGMGLDMAWNSVARQIRRVSEPFADEMELTNLEINLGVPRSTAMRHMAERTGVEDISSLVALLIQSDRFGASIVDALRTFAQTLRETRSQKAGEAAERMSVKLLFPMVIFIFPALLIVMVGPAVLELLRVVGNS